MIFEQYYLECLSLASYLIGDESSGRAIVVDPQRDIDGYLRDAEAAGLTIEWVIETHFHADFVSGHLELAAATGATIAYGPGAETEFESVSLTDGQRIELGEVTIEVRATPGHTPESISLVVWDTTDAAEPYAVLTGDTLFIGDVGRPDLLASAGISAEELGGQLYVSIHDKLLTLPDATKVFPAHGAGSACGKNLSTETQSTIGEQRATNYALAPMSADDFVDLVTDGQTTPPSYFNFDADLNRRDRDLLTTDAPEPLDLAGVQEATAAGAVVLDTRDPLVFATGHLRGSVNVGIDGRFAEFAGSVVSPDTPIVLVAEPGGEGDARVRLARIGYDAVVGFLKDPYATFASNPDQVAIASRLTAADLAARSTEIDGIQVIDVRTAGERKLGAIAGSRHIPITELTDQLTDLDPSRPTVVFCAGGYRSSIAASVLRHAGFDDVSDLLGGYQAWARANPGQTAEPSPVG